MNTFKGKASDITHRLEAVRSEILQLGADIDGITKQASKVAGIDFEEMSSFFKEPWCIQPKGNDSWLVIVPKFVGLQIGWLERSTDTYNVFVVNRYAHWLGNIPEELKGVFQVPEALDATVEDGVLKTSVPLPKNLKEHVSRRVGPGRYKVKQGRGHEFHLMAKLIDSGALPFSPRAVLKSDMRDVGTSETSNALRDYQVEGWNRFLETGAVGIYWPYGQGKTVFGVHAIAHLKGRKLIVCPTRTLVEQWQKRLREWLPAELRGNVEIVTYNSWNRVRNEDWMLVIFDECHRLPANTFSRLASVRTKYRIGLSATPYREDGRTNYIFALTGFPVGVDWGRFIREGRITQPEIDIRIVKGWNEKKRITEEEVRSTARGKVLVFCDSVSRGRELANRLGCPHVHGGTKNRLESVDSSSVSVISRVGDEGISVPELKKTIEVDFLGGSRRQEGQRVGRLFHANGKGTHIALLTAHEYSVCEKRFLALEEKGMKIRVTGF